MPTVRSAALGLLLVAAMLFTVGCGSGRHAQARRASALPGTTSGGPPSPSGIAADPAKVAVIRQWADALRRGNVLAAARDFALPSVLVNGADAAGRPTAIEIRSLRDAVLANTSLPCGAKFVAADRRGRFINALFSLTGRPGPGGGNCADGVGQTARTDFVIAHGKIVQWVRAPDDPGDNGTPAPSPTIPQPPATPTNPTPTTPSQPTNPTPPSGGGPAV
jgi:hypothetical protein